MTREMPSLCFFFCSYKIKKNLRKQFTKLRLYVIMSTKGVDMKINQKKCISCGTCVAICPVEAISFDSKGKAVIDQKKCIHCGACASSCPVNAIDFD